MFIRNKHYDNAIQKVKILLGKELGLDKEEDAYVVFREPSERDVVKLKTAETTEARIDAFQEIFAGSIVEHNFYENDNEKMADAAVIELLFEKIDTTDKLVEEYSDKVFRSRLPRADER